ncbi:MAG: hypothetical protein AAFX99_05015 [Myxococcota bacterium]
MEKVAVGCGCALVAAVVLFLVAGGGVVGLSFFAHEVLDFRPDWNKGENAVIAGPIIGVVAALFGAVVSFAIGYFAASKFWSSEG